MILPFALHVHRKFSNYLKISNFYMWCKYPNNTNLIQYLLVNETIIKQSIFEDNFQIIMVSKTNSIAVDILKCNYSEYNCVYTTIVIKKTFRKLKTTFSPT